MLRIKWNKVPSIFKYAGAYFNLIDGSIIKVEVGCYEAPEDGIWRRELVPEEYEFNSSEIPQVSYMILQSREEWEAEQWKLAPEWAMYYVWHPINRGGWYQCEPHHDDFSWRVDDGKRCEHMTCFQFGEDWKQSLRKRPEAMTNSSTYNGTGVQGEKK